MGHRHRDEASLSEVGGQGSWQRVVLGLSMTGSQEVPLRRALEKAVAFVESTHLAEVVASEIEMIRLPLEGEGAFDPEAFEEEEALSAWPPAEEGAPGSGEEE